MTRSSPSQSLPFAGARHYGGARMLSQRRCCCVVDGAHHGQQVVCARDSSRGCEMQHSAVVQAQDAVAAPYAQGIIELASEQGILEAVYNDLMGLQVRSIP